MIVYLWVFFGNITNNLFISADGFKQRGLSSCVWALRALVILGSSSIIDKGLKML